MGELEGGVRISAAWTWPRGPVRLEDGVLRFSTEARPYPAAAEDGVLWALAGVEDAEDALRIARRYGPLRPLPVDGAEPVDDWLLEGGLLHGTLHLLADVSPARLADPGGMAALRARWEDAMPGAVVPRSDRALLAEVTAAIVEALARGLARATVTVDQQGAEMRVAHVPDSLLGLAYLQLARLVAAEDAVRRCLECGRVFPVPDPRQRYCSERHATRARLRRFRQARKASGVPASG